MGATDDTELPVGGTDLGQFVGSHVEPNSLFSAARRRLPLATRLSPDVKLRRGLIVVSGPAARCDVRRLARTEAQVRCFTHRIQLHPLDVGESEGVRRKEHGGDMVCPSVWDRSSDAVFGMLWTFSEERELLVLGGELIATVQPDNPCLHVKPLRQHGAVSCASLGGVACGSHPRQPPLIFLAWS